MTTRLASPARARQPQRGFTLINVLVAAFIFGIGMLGIARAFVGLTSAASQNTNVSSIASLSNSFWSVVQANSATITAFASNGAVTYTSSNYSSAPPAIQPWLLELFANVPGASAQITPAADSASGAACSAAGGCTITLVIAWTQTGSNFGNARSQTFTYRIGL